MWVETVWTRSTCTRWTTPDETRQKPIRYQLNQAKSNPLSAVSTLLENEFFKYCSI